MVSSINGLKHFPEQVKSHQASAVHVDIYVKLKTFSFCDRFGPAE
jgi:hypothetical protein